MQKSTRHIATTNETYFSWNTFILDGRI